MQNETVTFTVPIAGAAGEEQWIKHGEPWALTTDEAEAATFEFRTSLKVRDQIPSKMRMHELAGGLSAYLDLETGLDNVRTALRNRLSAQVWPEGRPEADTPDDRKVQDELLEAALEADDSREKKGLVAMEELHGRLVYLANWPSLFVKGPPGWEDLAETGVPDSILGWVRVMHSRAVLDFASGKAPPSE
jgi:hypothetical protein